MSTANPEWADFAGENGPDPFDSEADQEAMTKPECAYSDQQNEWQICDHEKVKSLATQLADSDDKTGRKIILASLVAETRRPRQLPKVTSAMIQEVDRLRDRFPNFTPFLKEVARDLLLSERCGQHARLSPILLVGPSGLGKTEITRHIAKALGATPCLISLPECTAAMVLTGSSSQWASAKIGRIAQAVIACDNIPMYVFDELDKCPKGVQFPIEPALLALLEPKTQAEFRDEFLGLGLDLTRAQFVFTANDLNKIEPALRDRLRIVRVSAPNPSEMTKIVKSVESEIREHDTRYKQLFLPISKRQSELFPVMAPRKVWQSLRNAFSSAAPRVKNGQKCRLRDEDIADAIEALRDPPARTIGFVGP